MREGYVGRAVCVSHLTSGASVCSENAVTGSAGNKGQNISGVFSATAPLPRSSAPSLGWPYIRSAIFAADNTHAHCAYASSQGSRDVDAPCRKLYSRSSFTIILGLESSARDSRDCSPVIADSAE